MTCKILWIYYRKMARHTRQSSVNSKETEVIENSEVIKDGPKSRKRKRFKLNDKSVDAEAESTNSVIERTAGSQISTKSRDMSNDECIEYPSFDTGKENTSETVATGLDKIANGNPDSIKINFDACGTKNSESTTSCSSSKFKRRSGANTCMVLSCPSPRQTGIIYHGFPKSHHPELQKEWLKACGRSENTTVLRHMRVCR